MKMENLYKTPYGSMECYPTYLIFRFEGNALDAKEAMDIMKYAYDHYGKRKFVFISNRPFESDIHPKAYKAINSKLMVGLAIVSATEAVKQEAANEQSLYKGVFSFFKTVDEAVNWALTVL